MNFQVVKSTRLCASPVDMIYHNKCLYILTKSNKIIKLDCNMITKRTIKLTETAKFITSDDKNIRCISKKGVVHTIDADGTCVNKTKLNLDISFITTSTDKYLIGLRSGKVLHVDYNFRAIRSYYGTVYRVMYAYDGMKDKMISVDNKIAAINTKFNKTKYVNVGFISSADVYNKTILVCGTDEGVYLYDMTLEKVIKFSAMPYVTTVRVVKDAVLIGTRDKTLYVCIVQQGYLTVINQLSLDGVITFIREYNAMVYVGVGIEEREYTTGRDKKCKCMVYMLEHV